MSENIRTYFVQADSGTVSVDLQDLIDIVSTEETLQALLEANEANSVKIELLKTCLNNQIKQNEQIIFLLKSISE